MTTSASGPLTYTDLAAMPGVGRRYELIDGVLLVTPFTRADLAAAPGDGRCYEIVGGVLVVTPLPDVAHQTVVGALHATLRAAVPPGLLALVAPVTVALPDSVLQPDVLVARRADLTATGLVGAPVLAVEVTSRHTSRFDHLAKRETYEDAGTLAYWVVDPDVPRLVAWELRDGAYVEVADVSGDEAFAATVPFEVTVVPSALAAG